MHTKESLTRQLQALGIVPTDLLTVHTSLKAVGSIASGKQTGADVLLDALRDCVPDGLLLIPSHTWKNIRETPVFDVRHSVPCIGTMPRVAVERANAAHLAGDSTVIRSLHPAHSVVAFGKNAEAYTYDDRFATTPMPANGSYRKLEQQGGKILLIGVGLTSNTFIHAVDEFMEPDGVSAPYPVTVIDYDGTAYHRQACNCKGPSAAYEQYRPYLEQAGALRYGKIGDADATLCDAEKTFACICDCFWDFHHKSF